MRQSHEPASPPAGGPLHALERLDDALLAGSARASMASLMQRAQLAHLVARSHPGPGADVAGAQAFHRGADVVASVGTRTPAR